jgi:hypothetical protein
VSNQSDGATLYPSTDSVGWQNCTERTTLRSNEKRRASERMDAAHLMRGIPKMHPNGSTAQRSVVCVSPDHSGRAARRHEPPPRAWMAYLRNGVRSGPARGARPRGSAASWAYSALADKVICVVSTGMLHTVLASCLVEAKFYVP